VTVRVQQWCLMYTPEREAYKVARRKYRQCVEKNAKKQMELVGTERLRAGLSLSLRESANLALGRGGGRRRERARKDDEGVCAAAAASLLQGDSVKCPSDDRRRMTSANPARSRTQAGSASTS
jgi:hypothetical protein